MCGYTEVNATLTTHNIACLLYYPGIDVEPMNVSEPLPQHFCSLVYHNKSNDTQDYSALPTGKSLSQQGSAKQWYNSCNNRRGGGGLRLQNWSK